MAASLCRSLFHLPSPSPSFSPPLRTQQTPFPFLSNPNPNSMLSITTPKLPALLYAVGGGGGGNTKEGKMTLEGVVTEALPNCMFRVKLDGGDTILGYIGGKVKKNKIWVMPGNRVRLEISKYDSSKGRIVYKLR